MESGLFGLGGGCDGVALVGGKGGGQVVVADELPAGVVPLAIAGGSINDSLCDQCWLDQIRNGKRNRVNLPGELDAFCTVAEDVENGLVRNAVGIGKADGPLCQQTYRRGWGRGWGRRSG